jgi:hypothetical protein
MSDEGLFKEMLQQFADDTKVHSSEHAKVTERVLRWAAGKGITLEKCSGPKFMDRSIRTLKAHVRKIGDISFPDYMPRKLKPKKPRKRRAKKA